ncbi:hypothetical protein D9M69_701320 [compost metagenome]
MERADIVEADDRDIVRDRHPLVMEDLDHPDGDLVRAGEDRRCRATFLDEALCRLPSESHGVVAGVF